MKIAIISTFPYHTEVLGFILEYTQNHNLTVYTQYLTDSYFDYFKSLYNFEIRHIIYLEPLLHQYDIFIALSVDNPFPNWYTTWSKTWAVMHHHAFDNSNVKNIITLSPNVETPKHKLNIIPVYNGLSNLNYNDRQNIIVVIGKFKSQHCDQDFDTFVNNIGYSFIFINREDNRVTANYGKCYRYLNTSSMINIINKSRFILTRRPKFQDRLLFSGAITLALSHNTPLILSKDMEDTYHIPGLIYKSLYSELIPTLNNLTDLDYAELFKNTVTSKDKLICLNKDIFNKNVLKLV